MQSKVNGFLKKSILILLGGVFLTGCATNIERRQQSDYAASTTFANQKITEGNVKERGSSVFEITDDLYIDPKPISVTTFNVTKDLPEVFNERAEVNFQDPFSLLEFSARMAQLKEIYIVIAQEVIDDNAGQMGKVYGATASNQASTGAITAEVSAPTAAPAPSPVPGAQIKTKDSVISLNSLVYKGTVKGLLDTVAARLNLSWRWTGDKVEFYRYDTRMFELNALSGLSKTTAKISTASSSSTTVDSGSSGNTGSTGQDTEISSVTSLWEEVSTSLQALLSPKGIMTMSPSAGLVTVKDTPMNLSLVEKQINEFNKIFTRQVVLDVTVYAVENTGESNQGINWNTFSSIKNGSYNIALKSPSPSSVSGAISQMVMTSVNPVNAALNSTAVLNFLGSYGKASLVTSGTLISVNGQTVPLNVTKERGYLQSITVTPGANGSPNSSELTPGIATSGFGMNFTPRVIEGDKIVMRYTIDLANIDSIDEFTSGGNTIQLPSRSIRNFMQNVSLKSGQTLLLSGFQQVETSGSNTGVVSPSFWMLGGSKASTTVHRTIVILVTPYIVH